MPRFAANLSMMFTEVDFLDRFGAAARAGFKAVEFLFPYAHPAGEIKARLDEHGLEIALFNFYPGDWDAGEKGLAAMPGREEEFLASVDQALEYARALGVPKLHLMAGLADPDSADHRARYVKHVRYAAERAAAAIEPMRSSPAILSQGRCGRTCQRTTSTMGDGPRIRPTWRM